MTIPLSTKSYDHYSGAGTLSVYPITFPTYEDTTVKATITNKPNWSHIPNELPEWAYIADVDDLEVFELVLSTDFTLQNINRPSTTITLLDASAVPPGWVGPIPARQEWLDASGFLAAGYYLYVEFISNPMRPSTLTSGNQLLPALTKDLDRLTMHVKALDHKVDEGDSALDTKVTEGLEFLDDKMDAGFAALTELAQNASVAGGTTAGEYFEYNGTDAIWQSGLFQGFSLRYGASLSLASLRDALLYVFNFGYLAPTISLFCSPSQAVREKGDPVAAVTMSATTVKNSQAITAVTHYRNGVLVNTEAAPVPGGGVETFVESTPFADNMSFYSKVSDGTSLIQSNTVTYSYVYPYYSGAGAPARTAAQVAAMTKDIRTSTVSLTKSFTTVNGDVYYFAYPAAYGALTSIKDENLFETFGDWTLRIQNITGLDGNAVSYRIYEFNNPVVAGSTNYTFIR